MLLLSGIPGNWIHGSELVQCRQPVVTSEQLRQGEAILISGFSACALFLPTAITDSKPS